MAGGGLAIAIRSELFLPGLQIFTGQSDFARFFTMHGTYDAVFVGNTFCSGSW